ncbi:MAG: YihY/virulence factor BrkB family protein [Bacteroidota bacterium]|nr:YihY/virulence factor BrkB family protein [Bacteroidota bacterium]
MTKLKIFLNLFKEAFTIFSENHPVKFASAIAYFSLFALPSIFLIIVFFLSFIFSESSILRELQDQLSKVVGSDGAEILVVITKNYKEQAAESLFSIFIYSIIVYWLSTQLFRLFQNSLNDLWRLKPDFNSYWKKLWVQRIFPFVLVLLTGLMFFGSLIISQGLDFALNSIFGFGLTIEDLGFIINLFTAVMVFFWFSILYKILPSAKILWEPTFVGAAVTTLLFFIGIWLIWNFVIERDLDDIYDIAASIIVVALWVFYSSLVFLYGASFTKVYAKMRNKQIAPLPYSYKYDIVKHKDYIINK